MTPMRRTRHNELRKELRERSGMKPYDSLEDAIKAHPNSYVSFEKLGNCMVCKKYDDLRCGACFDCTALVDGRPIKGGHRLWERANPENTWYVGN